MPPPRSRRFAGRHIAASAGLVLGILVLGLVATLAVPVQEWRSGDQA